MRSIHNDYLGLVRRAEQQLGSMFWLELGFGQRALQVMQPDAHQLFKNKLLTSAHLTDMLGELFGKSIIAQDGPAHHHARTAMNPAFSPKGLSATELGCVFADMIEQRVRKWPEQGEIKLLAEMRELVLGLMFRLLGVPLDELPAWRVHYEDLMLLALRVPFDVPGSPLRRGRRAQAWLNERLMGFVTQARREPGAPGLVNMLVHARDEQGECLSDEELVDNLRLLVLAGHETSASTLSWMLSLLAEHPHVWDALCREARAFGHVPRSPKDVRKFPVAEALFRETLRLYPPVHLDTRRASVDFELEGRTVTAGSDVIIPIIHLCRLPSLYAEADSFRPERWLGRTEALSQVELVQFGGGPHFCLGYHLAWMEIVQVAVAIALVLDGKGLRPVLPSGLPAMRYLPLLHPSSRGRVAFVASSTARPSLRPREDAASVGG
jgi:cytochrome P450